MCHNIVARPDSLIRAISIPSIKIYCSDPPMKKDLENSHCRYDSSTLQQISFSCQKKVYSVNDRYMVLVCSWDSIISSWRSLLLSEQKYLYTSSYPGPVLANSDVNFEQPAQFRKVTRCITVRKHLNEDFYQFVWPEVRICFIAHCSISLLDHYITTEYHT